MSYTFHSFQNQSVAVENSPIGKSKEPIIFCSGKSMKDSVERTDPTSATTTIVKRSQMSVIQSFTRAISDCLADEMMLLNKDIEEDAFFNGLRSFVTDECAELREDTSNDYRRNQNPTERTTRSPQKTTHLNVETQEDDDRTDFLVSQNESNFIVPNMIVFKPKTRKSREEYDIDKHIETREWDACSNFFFQKPEDEETNQHKSGRRKKSMIARWKKQGIRTFRRSKSKLPTHRED